jgi:hypothetical protein
MTIRLCAIGSTRVGDIDGESDSGIAGTSSRAWNGVLSLDHARCQLFVFSALFSLLAPPVSG